MNSTFLVIVSLACCVLCHAQDKRYTLQSTSDIEYAIKALKAKLAPLLIDVFIEAGMDEQESLSFCEKWQSFGGLVEGAEAQIESDLKRANEILADLPLDVRRKYLALSYQWVGPSAILRDEVATYLKITQKQKEDLQNVYIDFYERLAPINRNDFSWHMNPTESKNYIAATENLCSERDNKMLDVLDASQKAAWNKLLGSSSDAFKDYRKYCEKYN